MSGVSSDMDERLKRVADSLSRARRETAKRIIGQDKAVDRVFITLMSGGHALLVGVPGLAKTLMVDTIARVFGLSSSRIQCTPDLMPADIIGSEVLEEGEGGKRSFRFIEGPVFTRFLMADEINRASPRTQSALLQAMQERTVSVAGRLRELPRPFHVLATQNPIEQEGTYPLPEAQLDRFLMQIDIGYPDLKAEREIAVSTTGNRDIQPEKVMDEKDLVDIQSLVREMPVGDSVLDGIVKLVRRGRPGPEAPDSVNAYVEWAPGPRASQALMLAGRAKALLEGRRAPSMDDVLDLAEPVLKHRMTLNYQARADGVAFRDVLDDIASGL